MIIRNPKYFLPLGLLFVAISILVSHFFPPDPITDFLVGVFAGMSVVLNLAGIYFESRKL
ncbi:MAG: hypothetical protein ACFFDR_00910 [Candidatus Thorarchaeota archaeon]